MKSTEKRKSVDHWMSVAPCLRCSAVFTSVSLSTIVIEHLIQASDIAHTMQHWHIYRKWNERFFEEMYTAYSEGRAEKDPSEFWYKGGMYLVIDLRVRSQRCFTGHAL